MAKRQYSHAHQTMRRDLDPLVQTGEVDCWRCGEAIEPGTPWDLGHDDLDPEQYRGPEHQRCNRATKGRAPNQPASIPFAPSGRCAPRDCEVCASEYRPTYSAQRTCGRACGIELKRRNRPPVERKPSQPKAKTACAVHFIECEWCSHLFTSARARRYCTKLCGDRACRVSIPTPHGASRQCEDCTAMVVAPRVKCDDCKRVTRRAAKRRYLKTESGRAERRRHEARRRKRVGAGVATAA